MTYRFFNAIVALLVMSTGLFAQGERKDKTAVTYEELYDEPYSVNKLFVGFVPLYADMFATNINAGYGVPFDGLHLAKQARCQWLPGF